MNYIEIIIIIKTHRKNICFSNNTLNWSYNIFNINLKNEIHHLAKLHNFIFNKSKTIIQSILNRNYNSYAKYI